MCLKLSTGSHLGFKSSVWAGLYRAAQCVDVIGAVSSAFRRLEDGKIPRTKREREKERGRFFGGKNGLKHSFQAMTGGGIIFMLQQTIFVEGERKKIPKAVNSPSVHVSGEKETG